jgi:hypothetical protein
VAVESARPFPGFGFGYGHGNGNGLGLGIRGGAETRLQLEAAVSVSVSASDSDQPGARFIAAYQGKAQGLRQWTASAINLPSTCPGEKGSCFSGPFGVGSVSGSVSASVLVSDSSSVDRGSPPPEARTTRPDAGASGRESDYCKLNRIVMM